MTTTTRKQTVRSKQTAKPRSARKSFQAGGADTARVVASPEERWQVIAVAAYHKAEKRGFAPGDELRDWIEAEKEIDSQLFG